MSSGIDTRLLFRLGIGAAAGLAIGLTGYPWIMVPVGYGAISASNLWSGGKPQVTVEAVQIIMAMLTVYFITTGY